MGKGWGTKNTKKGGEKFTVQNGMKGGGQTKLTHSKKWGNEFGEGIGAAGGQEGSENKKKQRKKGRQNLKRVRGRRIGRD